MQRPRPEDKDSAGRTRSHSSTPQVDVIVLTADPALLASLREAAGPAQNLLHAESPEAAVDLLVGGHCGIFVIDVALVRANVVELVEKLHSQFPEVLLLAAGRRDEQQAVAGLVGSGRIYRFLHKPISPARAELFLSTASRRYGDLHPHDSRSRLASGVLGKPSSRRYMLLGVILIIAIGAAVWWSSSDDRDTPISRSSVETPATDSVASDELVARADAAYAAGNVLPPTQNNALDSYRAVLRRDSSNEHARQQIERIVTTLERNTRNALTARDVRRARTALAELQQADPNHSRLAEFQAALLTLARQPRPASSPPSATPSTPVATPRTQSTTASPTPNVDLARAFLAANQLIDPPDASALNSLRAARSAGEDESAIQIAVTDLGTRLLDRASAALDANDLANAKAAYEAANQIDREFEAALPDLEPVAMRLREVEAALQRSTLAPLLERAIRLRQSGRLIEPAGDNAVEALQAAMQANAAASDVKAEQERLSFALLENTRTALAAGDIDRADVLTTRAEEILPGLPQTRALRERIGAARAQREEATTVLQAASLPRTREVPAVYPREALLSSIEGWVDLEFTISTEGVPSDIRVKASSPARMFDIAAIQALRQWRFEPIVRDGAPRARRAVLRMEFKLKG